MPEFTELFLDLFAKYGLFALGAVLFSASAGLPLPTTPLVMAVGALARQGTVGALTAFLVLLISILVGDIFSYWLGLSGGSWVERRLSENRQALMNQGRIWFLKYGALSILISHSLIPSLDVPINLAAGGSRYPFHRFLMLAVLGRMLWLLLFGAMGYALGSQWQRLASLTDSFIGWLGLAIVICLIAFAVARRKGLIDKVLKRAVGGSDGSEH